jgi:hypothetical protein
MLATSATAYQLFAGQALHTWSTWEPAIKSARGDGEPTAGEGNAGNPQFQNRAYILVALCAGPIGKRLLASRRSQRISAGLVPQRWWDLDRTLSHAIPRPGALVNFPSAAVYSPILRTARNVTLPLIMRS